MGDLGRYRKLFPRIWRHPEFKRLPKDGQRLALYLVSGPQTNRVGLFAFSVALAGEELNLSSRTLRACLAAVCEAFDWQFDDGAGVFLIPSWFRWNPPENPNVLKGNLKDLNELPPSRLLEAFADGAAFLAPELQRTFRVGLHKTFPERFANQDQEQVLQDQVQQPEQDSGRAAAAPQRDVVSRSRLRRDEGDVPGEDPDPEDHYAVITALITKEILDLRLVDGEALALTKRRCDELDIAYTDLVVRKAMDSALFRYYRKARLEQGLPPDPRGIYHDHNEARRA